MLLKQIIFFNRKKKPKPTKLNQTKQKQTHHILFDVMTHPWSL